jgi:cellulose synthase/poly-beta-1,6-N-acetylglucosamine synthase-like glycosyltransferase
MYLFYFLAGLGVWLGVQSLRGGLRYKAYVRKETSRPLSDFTPFVSVIAPNRGSDAGLGENIAALLNQNYPAYEILFVFDRSEDPGVEVIEEVQTAKGTCRGVATRSIVAGAATDSGQKVHNLRVAVGQTDAKCEILVFVDTDARPDVNWLREIVAPLADENLGAATGYRWFVPEKGGLASSLRSVWNASVASALGAARHKNFCWGGSTAIRRSTFEQLKIAERWRGSVSDDFMITRVLKEAKLPIHFTPSCLVPAVGDCDFQELFEFTTRQIKITRVYAPHLWKFVLVGNSLFALTFFGGSLLVLVRAALGVSFIIPIALLCVIFLLGAAKGFVRWQAVMIPLAKYRRELRRDLAAQILLWPLASLLYLHNAIAAGLSRRIQWRGITYELKSPSGTVIISRES